MTKPQLLRYSEALNAGRNNLAGLLNKLSTCPELQFAVLVKTSPRGLDCTYADKLHTWHLQEPHKDLEVIKELETQIVALRKELESKAGQ